MDLLLTRAYETDLVNAMAADVSSLAPAADANAIALIAENFTLAKSLVFADLVLATFTGSTPIEGAAGAQQVGVDPDTDDQIITILEPVGGYRFECTVAPDPPETIYGVALLNNGLSALIAVGKLPVPKVISAVGHFIDLGQIQLRFVSPLAAV